jgi:GGDEF domain-containing protein
MKSRLYLDTSVFGGYYDDEFAEHTVPLFARIDRGEFTVLLSSVTQEELEAAPERVKNLVKNLPATQTE